jgi:hypothetical protein
LCIDRKAPVDGAPSSSSAPSRSCDGGSAKNKAAQILANASWAIPCQMRRSFVDRQYSPSTGMDRREWEVILDQLIHKGYIVKEELDSDGNG